MLLSTCIPILKPNTCRAKLQLHKMNHLKDIKGNDISLL